MRKRSELIFSLILVPLDYLSLVAAFVAAYIIRVKLEDKPVAHPIAAHTFLDIALMALPVWILIFALVGLYAQSNLRGRFSEIGKVFVAVSGGVMFMILLDFLQPTSIFPSKAVPIYAYGLGLLLVVFSRTLVRAAQRSLFRVGIGVHRSLIIGSGELAQRIAADLASPTSGYKVVGCIDSARGAARRMPGLPVYAALEEALVAERTDLLDEFIQADSALEPDEVLELVSYATNHHIAYRFVPNQFGLYTTNSTLSSLAGIPMIEIRLTPLEGWGRIAKRVVDFISSLLGIIILSPLFLILAIIIKLTDPGPVFYKHRRLSRSGRELYMYKFRSMSWRYSDGAGRTYKTAESALTAMGHADMVPEFRQHQKLQHDPRVSRLGRFIRRTSIDELPQLINVLKGDMSLVGPRPIIPEELERYGEQGASFLALKPGITGLWQISGRSDIGYDERVKLDIYYVENWSLWLDFKILIKTMVSLASTKGAY